MQFKMMDFKSILKVKDALCILKEIFGTYFIQKCIFSSACYENPCESFHFGETCFPRCTPTEHCPVMRDQLSALQFCAKVDAHC